MNTPSNTHGYQHWDGMILKDLEGHLEEAARKQLHEQLNRDERFRQYYIEFVGLCGIMQRYQQFCTSPAVESLSFDESLWDALAREELTAPEVAVSRENAEPELIRKVIYPPREKYKVSKFSMLTLAASAAAVLFIVLFFQLVPARSELTVGRLTQTVETQWKNATGPLLESTDLYPGRMVLQKGLAKIIMNNGAEVIIESPCEFELESSSQIFLYSGSLVANIENAGPKRFVIRTPHSTVVDYGTEFGVKSDAAGNATVYVFEGSVEIRQGPDPLKYENKLRLNAGQGGRAGLNGQLSETAVIPETFLCREQFDTEVKAFEGSAYHRWKAYVHQLHRDSALVAHYTFERTDSTDDVLRNMAPVTAASLDGMLGFEGDKPQWVPGRWPRTTALQFNHHDRTRVVVPAHEALAINGPMTAAAWVYFDSDQNRGHIFSCRDEYQVNYQFAMMGENCIRRFRSTMHLARYADVARSSLSHSQKQEIASHQWHLLSATHDNQIIRFYLNGEFFSEVPYTFQAGPVTAPLVIGDIELKKDPEQYRTSNKFQGKIGEVIILKRILSPQEMRELYIAGKP